MGGREVNNVLTQANGVVTNRASTSAGIRGREVNNAQNVFGPRSVLQTRRRRSSQGPPVDRQWSMSLKVKEKSAAKSQGNNIISVRTDRFDWMARGRALGPRFWWLVEMRARWTHALVHVRTPTSSFLPYPPSSFVL